MEILKCKDGRFEVQILALLKCKTERPYKEEINKNHHQRIEVSHKYKPAREISASHDPPAKGSPGSQLPLASPPLHDHGTAKIPTHMGGASKPIPIDESRATAYATPADELKVLELKYTGSPIEQLLLDFVRSKLGGDVTQWFIDELKLHNGNFKNYAGFVRSRAGKRNRPASAPVTAAEDAAKNYQCPYCLSRTPGEGALLQSGKGVPCSCASVEYIAAQMTRGVFEANAAPAPQGVHGEAFDVIPAGQAAVVSG